MAIMKFKIPNPGTYNFRRTGKCFNLLSSLAISLKKVMDESGLGVNSAFRSTTLIFSPSGENLKKKKTKKRFDSMTMSIYHLTYF